MIGFLSSQSADGVSEPLRGFHRGLKEAGFVEGENLTIEYRWAENREELLPTLAADLVRRHVVAIAAMGTVSALAAKAATTTTPIVFNVGDDPVRLGLVASLARPGGNLTGVNFFTTELAAKRLALLRELVPSATRVAVLANPTSATITERTLRDLEIAAREMKLQIQILNANNGLEINAAFETIARERPDALFIGPGPFFAVPACAIDATGGPPRHPHDLSGTPPRRCRRIDQLWGEQRGRVASGCRLCWPHFERS